MGLMEFLSLPGQERTRRRDEFLGGLLNYYLGPTGIPERLGLMDAMNPVSDVGRAMTSSQEMLAPGRTPEERASAGLSMLTDIASVAAPGVATRMAGGDETAAVAESLLGFGGQTRQGVGDWAREFARREEGMFLGPSALTADQDALRAAQRMAEQGADRRAIWDETGWFQGVDGKWRFEVDDSGSAMKPYASQRSGDSIDLGEGFSHLELQRAYPEMFNDIRMRYERSDGSRGGYFRPANPSGGTVRDYIGVTAPQQPDMASAREIMLHELQHAVQNQEGFVSGATPSVFRGQSREVVMQLNDEAKRLYDQVRRISPNAPDWLDAPEETRRIFRDRAADSLYTRVAGEVEADNVIARQNLTSGQRRATPPWETMGVPEADQIVRFGVGGLGLLAIPQEEQ